MVVHQIFKEFRGMYICIDNDIALIHCHCGDTVFVFANINQLDDQLESAHVEILAHRSTH